MDRQFEDRLATVERALTDGETDLEAVTAGAATAEQVADLEERLETVEDEVADLDAATQALRGYVGEVRSVNESVEETAATAMAKAEEAQSAATTGADPPSGERNEESRRSSVDDEPGTQESARRSGHSGSTSMEPEPGVGQSGEGRVAGADTPTPTAGGTDGSVPTDDRETDVAAVASPPTGEPNRKGNPRTSVAPEPCPTCGRDGGERREAAGVDDTTRARTGADSGRAGRKPGQGSASSPRQPAGDGRVPEPAHRTDPDAIDGRAASRGRSAAGRGCEDAGLLSRIRERL